MTEYRDLTMMTKTGFQVIVMQAGKALIPILRLLNQLIQAGIHAFSQLNPQIKEGLAIGLRFAMLALMFSAMAKSLGLVLKFIPALKTFIGLLKLFRLAFLASPIGIILALGAALALLYDDYKTWRDGGKSLFDWSKWTNGIDTIINKIKDFLDILNKVKDKTVEFVQKIIKDPAGALKEVATEVQQGVQNAKNAVQNYVNPSEPSKATPLQNKVSSASHAVQGAIEQSVAVAAGVAKATVRAVKGAVNSGTKSFSQNITSKKFTSKKAKTILRVAKEIGVNPNDLAAVISFETGGTFSPSVKNPNSSATGLIQFMEGSGGTKGKYYGMSRKKFSSLSFDEQMEYVEKYFKDRGFKSSRKRDVADLYTAVTGYGYKKGSKAYELNKVWDSNGDGYIAKGEMVQNKSFKAHQKNYYSQNDLSSFNQPVINNYGPPKGNPNKSDINASNLTSSNVTIYQSYQTDMTINGASNPLDSANAVKRQQENSMVLMARNAKGIMV
nr:hypothetical protein [Acinetobacter nosocomialis]